MQTVIDPKLVEEVCEARLQERSRGRLVEVAQANRRAQREGLRVHLDRVLVAVSLGLQAGQWPFAVP